MTEPAADAPGPWSDALLAAAMLAVDPAGLSGVHVQSRAGPVRDRWLATVCGLFAPRAPVRRIASGISEARLTGGLDIGLTVERGRPVVEQGVLASADGGLLVLAMAERLALPAAAVIGMALDSGEVRIERDGLSLRQPARFALVALDEGIDADEALAPSLSDRLGLRVDLDAIGWRDVDGEADPGAVARARTLLPTVSISEDILKALCEIALSAGAPSMRAPLHLVRAARAAAALRGCAEVEVRDAATALRLVLGMRSSAVEEAPQMDEPSASDASPDDADDTDGEDQALQALPDTVVEAAEAVLPEHILAGLEAMARTRRKGMAGKAGASSELARRGRAVGVTDRPLSPGARIDVLSTLRQAAPWQRIRARAAASEGRPIRRLHIRKTDFRYLRYREKTGTTAIFAVDASGSAAVERLAETKGAIELLLAQCYVRRDQVAMIAFRGKRAETLLEPTRSLVRAKRSLAALPGGGGTPLAGGILAALALAEASARKGASVVAVFLTDGRGNVGLDGGVIREQVAEDTRKAVTMFRSASIRAIVIDTARRPQARAEALARDLGAEYLPLPRGGSSAVAREIGARMEG